LPLADLEQQLGPHGFVRVHRRALLNLARVQRLEPSETGGFIARTLEGHAVEVSRQAARELRKRLGLRR
jgi:two-component system LytT family response regulator